MILTEKLKLKKPDQDDFIDVDDINHNTDIIDDVLGDANKHVISKLLSKEGVHGLRVVKRSLQVYDKGKWKTINNGGLNYVAPDNMRKFNAEIFERNKVKLTFLEPLDTMLEDDIISKVSGVMIRYSTETYPETTEQGNLAINNLQLGKYENSPFELTDLKYNTTYYFTAFPYSDMELYNTSVTNQNRLMIKTQEIEAVAPSSMRKFEVTPQGDGLLLTFEEPLDTIIDGEIASKVAGVMIRYSTVSHPTTIEDGTLAIDNKELGKYKTNGFELKGLNHLNTYYISAFPYSDKNLYNTENNASNRVSAIPLGAEQITVLSNKDCQIRLTIGNDYQNTISISEQIPFNFTVNKGVVYKIEPFSISDRYKTPNKTVKVAVAGDNTEINLNYEKIKVLNDYSWTEIKQLQSEGQLKEIINISIKLDKKAYKYDKDYGQTWNVTHSTNNSTRFVLAAGNPIFLEKISALYPVTSTDRKAVHSVSVRYMSNEAVTIKTEQNPTYETDKLSYKVAQYFKDKFPYELRDYIRAYSLNPSDRVEDLYGYTLNAYDDNYTMKDINGIRRGFMAYSYLEYDSKKSKMSIGCYEVTDTVRGSNTYKYREQNSNMADDLFLSFHNDLLPFTFTIKR